uniref:Uncharacterized protein n=1 Tax=Phlebotomus papatasi TaxID=29031 RepID=A0A1B0DJC2_PHLPP
MTHSRENRPWRNDWDCERSSVIVLPGQKIEKIIGRLRRFLRIFSVPKEHLKIVEEEGEEKADMNVGRSKAKNIQ